MGWEREARALSVLAPSAGAKPQSRARVTLYAASAKSATLELLLARPPAFPTGALCRFSRSPSSTSSHVYSLVSYLVVAFVRAFSATMAANKQGKMVSLVLRLQALLLRSFGYDALTGLFF